MPFFDGRHFDEDLQDADRPGATLAALDEPALPIAALAEAIATDAVRLIAGAATVSVSLAEDGPSYVAERLQAVVPAKAERLVLMVTVAGRHAGQISICNGLAGPFQLADRYAAQLLAALATAALTQRRLAETEHQATIADRRFHATFTHAPAGIAHVAIDGRFIRINDQFCEIVGHSREALLADGFQRITHPDDLDGDVAQFHRLLAEKGGRYMMEKRYVRDDGAVVWVNLSVALVTDSAGEPEFFVSVIEDLSKLKQAHHEATHDPLTGLLNRRGLVAEIDREIARDVRAGTPLTTIYLDLDDFKAVNDRFGHPAGDECLVEVGRALSASTRPTDLVARVGGDEFVLVLPGASLDDGRNAVERMRRAIEELGADATWRIRGSFGLTSSVARLGITAADLIARADAAMFAAKRGGKDRIGLYDEPAAAGAL